MSHFPILFQVSQVWCSAVRSSCPDKLHYRDGHQRLERLWRGNNGRAQRSSPSFTVSKCSPDTCVISYGRFKWSSLVVHLLAPISAPLLAHRAELRGCLHPNWSRTIFIGRIVTVELSQWMCACELSKPPASFFIFFRMIVFALFLLGWSDGLVYSVQRLQPMVSGLFSSPLIPARDEKGVWGYSLSIWSLTRALGRPI